MRKFLGYIILLFVTLILTLNAAALPSRYFIRTFNGNDGGMPMGWSTGQCNHCRGKGTGLDLPPGTTDAGWDSLALAGITGVNLEACALNGVFVGGKMLAYAFDPDSDGGRGYGLGCNAPINDCYIRDPDADKTITAGLKCQRWLDDLVTVRYGGVTWVPNGLTTDDAGVLGNVNVKIYGCYSPTGAGGACQ